jgi:type VI secretion system secreted protein VgrG
MAEAAEQEKQSEPMGEIVGLTVTLEPDTSVRVGQAVEIHGTLEFRLVALGAIGQIASSENGEALLQSLHETGGLVAIVETRKGNAVTELSPQGERVTVFFNPKREATGQGGEEWETRPPALGLAHVLIRAEQMLRGAVKPGATGEARDRDLEAVGLEPHGDYPFSENKIRAGWKPPLPPREQY